MKFRLLFLIVFYFFCSFIWATENYLSPQTRLLLEQYAAASKKAKPLESAANENVHLLLLISDAFDISSLDSLDVMVQSDFDSVLTVVAPMKSLPSLVNLSGLKYVRAGMPVKPELDRAVPFIGADKVQKGIDLKKAYTGEGVIIGLVDFGLDFTHPAFFSPDGKLRISRAWIQTEGGRSSGKNVKYGTEYVGQSALLAKGTSNTDSSHGTHVCGIAAGSSDIYKGVAPGAEIVFVETKGTDVDVLDAVKYIFDYAGSVAKPAVVNLSLGTHSGPHDGSSFLNVNMDKLSGEGKIVVGAAGNEGAANMHIRHSFLSSTDTLRTVIEMDWEINSSIVNVWGEARTSIDAAIEIYDINTKEVLYSSPFGSTSGNYELKKSWHSVNGEIIDIKLYSQAKYAGNGKPNIEVRVDNPVSGNYAVVLLLKGTAGKKVDLWNSGQGYGAELTSLTGTNKTGWTVGDNTSTIGEIGTTNKMITVGAYVTKNVWTDLSGRTYNSSFDIGDICSFSSKGPTADGRTKPDITAPGSLIVSALNSLCPDYTMSGNYRNILVAAGNRRGYFYGVMDGTSMATPMVTGAVALMLQKNPTLTPDEIKALLRQYSEQDVYTGLIDENGSNIWGYGKLNVFEMIKSKEINPIPEIGNVIVYNASNKSIGFAFNIDTEIEMPITKVEVFTVAGQKVVDTNVSIGDIVDLSHCRSGVLLVKIYSGKDSVVRKIVLL